MALGKTVVERDAYRTVRETTPTLLVRDELVVARDVAVLLEEEQVLLELVRRFDVVQVPCVREWAGADGVIAHDEHTTRQNRPHERKRQESDDRAQIAFHA
jgi:hypothetical protein